MELEKTADKKDKPKKSILDKVLSSRIKEVRFHTSVQFKAHVLGSISRKVHKGCEIEWFGQDAVYVEFNGVKKVIASNNWQYVEIE